MKRNRIQILATAIICWSAASISLEAGRPPHGPPPWVEDPSDNTEIVLRIEALEEFAATLSTDLEAILPYTLPEGSIMSWAGFETAIPEGWALCDGQNDTPDLRDRFVIGASNDTDWGTSGGSTEHQHGAMDHDHTVATPTHAHSIQPWEGSTETTGEHSHELGRSFSPEVGLDDEDGLGIINNATVTGHNHFLRPAGDHHHYIELGERTTSPGEGLSHTTSVSTQTATATHLPPYYQLAFIIKVEGSELVIDTSSASSPLDRLADLEESALLLSQSLKLSSLYKVPSGLIVAWSGSPTNVPEGWYLTDGNNGTPDLRGKFILGAIGDSDIGTTGGSADHTHSAQNHSHEAILPDHYHWSSWSGSTSSVGDHTHPQDSPYWPVNTIEADEDPYPEGIGLKASHYHEMTAAGGHSHQLTIPNLFTGVSGGTGSTEEGSSSLEPASLLPPFYKFAYIQKSTVEGIGVYSGLALTPLATDDSTELLERIEALEELFATLWAVLDVTNPFLAPSESIGLWSSTLDSIPEGWAMCDGQDGTPDLRDYFVMGTIENQGDVGGSLYNAHTIESHNHVANFPHGHPSINTAVYETEARHSPTWHVHDEDWGDCSWLPNGFCVFNADNNSIDLIEVTEWMHTHVYPQASFEHEHTVELSDEISSTENLEEPTGFAEGATSSVLNLPPFFRLAFVMKLPELENDE